MEIKGTVKVESYIELDLHNIPINQDIETTLENEARKQLKLDNLDYKVIMHKVRY